MNKSMYLLVAGWLGIAFVWLTNDISLPFYIREIIGITAIIAIICAGVLFWLEMLPRKER